MDAGNLNPELVQKHADGPVQIKFQEGTKIMASLKNLKIGLPADHLPRTPFTILLVTNGEFTAFPQQTYCVEWEGLGQFDLFLVPVGPAPEGMQYEAVFG